tara:strand:+ start:144 stop:572 length:429 start_codon:yes stop_codon:yes gene_type:complete
MAEQIKLENVGKFVEGEYNKLIKAAVVETYGSLVQKSPVDTGRFRASWAVGQNSATFQGEPAGKSSYPAPNPKEPRKIGYDKEKTGNTYVIYNNLPYAEKLANAPLGQGSSIQTNGPGWVAATSKHVQRMIPTLAKQVETES